jgi:hypothetical protein
VQRNEAQRQPPAEWVTGIAGMLIKTLTLMNFPAKSIKIGRTRGSLLHEL